MNKIRILSLIASISIASFNAVLMQVVTLFESLSFAMEQVLNPVWSFVGSVRVTAQTLYGYASKAAYRLLVYDPSRLVTS